MVRVREGTVGREVAMNYGLGLDAPGLFRYEVWRLQVYLAF